MDFLANLPTPTRLGLAVIVLAVILAALGFAFHLPPAFYIIMAMGIVFVALLLLAFHALINLQKKRKANPLQRGLADNSASAPQGISEPARRARLDDLRRNFEQGIEKFNAAGKDLYSVPWYVLVGEAGSGKTEAIRHCNVGFPPGLQDQLQGAGGTLNMNWWFTNHAIIIDTAGRIMFEEAPAGTTTEWQEFLKLLRSNRPNCPINGMLLVIPADSLVKDSDAAMDAKATRIAQQLDNIQRALGVRFPVFIIITKCDLLYGFREFFDDLNDPQLQHQMMGWSNPAPLDDRFNASVVEQHLERVKQRLVERRARLMLDPVSSGDPQTRRIDQMDALYALPETLMKIAPRLRQYLEKIFVAGEWSPKPLFLRGIYFTSSMTEGAALDADLAAALGVPMDNLPEGRMWQRDRAFFLRDLFMTKVFREKGLVTHAANAKRQQQGRKLAILSTGFAAVLVLFALTWFGARTLNKSIGQETDFWQAAQNLNPAGHLIVNPKAGKWNFNDDQFDLMDDRGSPIQKDLTISQLFNQKLELVQHDIPVPVIFRWVALFGGEINTSRRQAYRALFDQCIIAPLFTAAETRLRSPEAPASSTQTNAQTEALVELLRAELANLKQLPADDSTRPTPVDLSALFAYVLPESQFKTKLQSTDDNNPLTGLQKDATYIYSREAGGSWPPAILNTGTAESAARIDAGLTKVLSSLTQQNANQSPNMAKLLALRDALRDYQAAEDALLSRQLPPPETLASYQAFAEVFHSQVAKLAEARTRASAAVNSLALTGDTPLPALYESEVNLSVAAAQDTLNALLKYLPENSDKFAAGQPIASVLSNGRQKVIQATADLATWKTTALAKPTLDEMDTLDKNLLARIKSPEGPATRRYELSLQLAQTVDAHLPKLISAPSPSAGGGASQDVATSLSRLDKDASDARAVIDRIAALAPTRDDRLAGSVAVARFALDAGQRCSRYQIVADALGSMPATTQAIAQYVESQSSPADSAMSRDSVHVPLTQNDPRFPARFDPAVASRIITNQQQISSLLDLRASADDPGNLAVLERSLLRARLAQLQPALQQYRAAYVRYWGDEVFSEMKVSAKDFTDFADQLAASRESTINVALVKLGEKAAAALSAVGDPSGAAAKIQAATAASDSRVVQQAYGNLLDNWADLKDNAENARAQILSQRPRHFLENYILDEPKSDDDFIATYWRNFTVGALHILALDAEMQVTSDVDKLVSFYKRFPLATPDDKQAPLTAQDIGNARAILLQIMGSLKAPGAEGPVTLADGAPTNDKPVDSEMEHLRGGHSLSARAADFIPMKALLQGLPENNKTVSCTLTIDKSQLFADDNSPRLVYAKLVISLNNKTLSTIDLRDSGPDNNEKAAYPSGDLTFTFYADPHATAPDQTLTIPGIWSPLRLLHQTSATRDSRDPHKWSLTLPLGEKAGAKRNLPILIEFEQEIPELSDWPQPSR